MRQWAPAGCFFRLAEQDTSWGTKVVERLARDLKAAFPDMAGFSRTNLFYMRQVFLAWTGAGETVQQLVGLIPWGHHLVLVSKVDDSDTRAWYLEQAVAHGWSRAVLTVQIESRLHVRQGKALTNFDRAKRCYEKAGLTAEWEKTVNQLRTEHHRKTGFMSGFEDLVAGSGPSDRPSFLERAKTRWGGRQRRGDQ